MNSFKDLIRKNPFIALQNNQVIKSSTGNFGIKQNLHKNLIKFQFNAPIKHGQKDFEETQRALELGLFVEHDRNQILDNKFYFGDMEKNLAKEFGIKLPAKQDKRLPNLSYKPLDEMEDHEFVAWIKYAKEKQNEFAQKVKSKELSSVSYREFLTLDQLETPVSPMPMNYTKPTEAPAKVKGRVLAVGGNNSLLIGICGFVAQLDSVNIPSSHAELRKYLYKGNRQINRQKEYLFTINEVKLDENCELIIKVSLQPTRKPRIQKSDGLFDRPSQNSQANDAILDKIMKMIDNSK
jgi:hypothetical protein